MINPSDSSFTFILTALTLLHKVRNKLETEREKDIMAVVPQQLEHRKVLVYFRLFS